MSRLPPELSRRIDRLARHAHAFHRFAHHPLCTAYRTEVLRLGRRTRLCRGCAAAATGGLLGLSAGWRLSPLPAAALAVAAAVFVAASFVALAPRASRPWPKLLTRFAPSALGGAVISGGLAGHRLADLACALSVAAAVLLAARVYGRRGPDRGPCTVCPDRDHPRTCSGFLPIARREAAFRRLAGGWIRSARGGAE